MEETTRYLLIGGGLASVWAAQNIRERDPEGRILIVGKEPHPPYDKPPLSKQYLAEDNYSAEDAYSKFDNFYSDNRIQLHTGVRAIRIDRAARTVALDNGGTIRYEKLLLATGSAPRTLKMPGSDLRGVFYLRTLDDAEAIRTAMQHSRRAVLIGAGYLNMEVASGCLSRGIETTILEPTDYPWSRFASPTLGGFMRQAYEAKGARFLFGEEAAGFTGDGSLTAVRTKRGAELRADFAVAAVGAKLRTELAQEAGLEVDPRQGVMVNEYLQTSDPNIWAAGDIACFQDVALGKRWHAEHHLNAKWQGRAVGAIMAGEQKPYDQVPYFFSDFLDLHMIQRGDPGARRETTVLGNLKDGEFVELYPDDQGVLRMGVAISHEEKTLDPLSDKLEELIRAKAPMAGLTAATFGL